MAALPENLVYWALPDNADSFAKSISSALEKENYASSKGMEYARGLTWEKRGERLHNFLSKELEEFSFG